MSFDGAVFVVRSSAAAHFSCTACLTTRQPTAVPNVAMGTTVCPDGAYTPARPFSRILSEKHAIVFPTAVRDAFPLITERFPVAEILIRTSAAKQLPMLWGLLVTEV